ncbi:hypothetical protein Tco_0392891, partial [Tanacetum coccineum]
EDVEVQEVPPMGRDRVKKKASSSGARSEFSVAGDPSLVDALLSKFTIAATPFFRRGRNPPLSIVMSDSKDSTVTYTAVSSPFGGMSDIGSPGVDGPPMMPEDPYAYVVAAFQAPPSPDYVPGPEEPEQAPLLPEFVPEPVYLKFMPPEEDVVPVEEQPLPAAVFPIADSPRYIVMGYVLYAECLEKDICSIVLSSDIVVPPSSNCLCEDLRSACDREHTKILSPLPHILSPPLPVSPLPLPISPTYPLGYRAAMIWLRAESPSTTHLLPLPSPIILSYTRASVAMMRAAAPSTYILTPGSGILPSETPPSGTLLLLPIPLPTSSPPLLLPSTNCRAGVFEVTLPPRKRLCIALGLRFEVGESSSAPTARPTGGFRADYGNVSLWMMKKRDT